MHSLSNILGAPRQEDECSVSNARLSHEAENSLQDAVYGSAAANPLADILFQRLKQPFEESRIAALRLANFLSTADKLFLLPDAVLSTRHMLVKFEEHS